MQDWCSVNDIDIVFERDSDLVWRSSNWSIIFKCEILKRPLICWQYHEWSVDQLADVFLSWVVN